jgi:hypothetical protein
MDVVAVSSLVVALSTAIGYIIHQLHLRNCQCCCIKSDCVKSSTPSQTPTSIFPAPLLRGHPADPDQQRNVKAREVTPLVEKESKSSSA